MDLLTPGLLPFLFLAIGAVFGFNYLRHRHDAGQRIAQRNRWRLALAFAVIGGGQLLWRLLR